MSLSLHLTELEKDRLQILYEYYFENHAPGIMRDEVIKHLGGSTNDVSRAFDKLESYNLIDAHQYHVITITATGIDAYEQLMLPSELSPKQAQRAIISNTKYDITPSDVLTFTEEELKMIFANRKSNSKLEKQNKPEQNHFYSESERKGACLTYRR